MKSQIILTTTLTALLPLAAIAQSPVPSVSPAAPQIAPAPPAPAVPPAPRIHGSMHERDRGPKEPVTFLGVETSDVPRVLTEQMGLPRGFGVVVDYVVPEGPAAAAGVQQSDIIRMLNDQIIVDPNQLGKLVRSFDDGTTVNLTLLRKGKETKVSVKLKKHDTAMGRGPFGFEQDWNFDDLDKMKFDFKAPDMSAVRDAAARAKAEALRAGEEARREMRNLRVVRTNDGTTKATRFDLGNANIVFSDEQGELKIQNTDGRKTLIAHDPQGKVLFNGPIDTEEQRAKVPAQIRERFEKLESQELPEIPPAPEDRRDRDGNESVRLQNQCLQRASLSPAPRTGWVRSTTLL